jgi:Tfp pilus assembly protein PilP
MMRPLAIALCLLLAACGQTIHSCPPVSAWTDEARNQLADEVEALPDGTMIERAVNEYGVMRAQARACR